MSEPLEVTVTEDDLRAAIENFGDGTELSDCLIATATRRHTGSEHVSCGLYSLDVDNKVFDCSPASDLIDLFCQCENISDFVPVRQLLPVTFTFPCLGEFD